MTSETKARELMHQFCKAFGAEASQRGYRKLALRRWLREEKSFSIALGLQKSQWGPSLYVNCGVVYEGLGGSANLQLPRDADVSARAQEFLAPGARRALNDATDFESAVKAEARMAVIPKIFEAVLTYAEKHPTAEKYLSGKRVGMLTRRMYDFDEKRSGRTK